MRTQTEAFTGQPATILSAAKEVARDRGWTVASESGNELEFRTKVSVKSWGESIKVRVDLNQFASGTLLVTVSSSGRFQVYDWGKSADNVGILMEGLKQRVQGSQGFQVPVSVPAVTPNQATKFCANCGMRLAAAMPFCTRCGQRAD